MWRMRILTCLVVLACSGGGDDDPAGPGPGPGPGPSNQTLGSITTNVTTLDLGAGEFESISVTAFDTENRVISGAPSQFSSNATNVAEVDAGGEVLGIEAGTALVTVSVTHNGVTKTAQVTVNVTGQLSPTADVVASSSDYVFTPSTVVITSGGTVTWSFGNLEHTVSFAPVGGAPSSITSGGYATDVSRTFNNAGDFAYNCTIHPGMSGTVVVR
jgi:plastocyanin